MAKCYILKNSVVKTWAFMILLLGILGIVLTIYYYTELAGLKREFMTVSQRSRMARLAGSAPGTSGTLEAPHLVAVAGAVVRRSLGLWFSKGLAELAVKTTCGFPPLTQHPGPLRPVGGWRIRLFLGLCFITYLAWVAPQHHGLRTAKLFHLAAGCCET